MKHTFTATKDKPMFTGWEHFSTPIWNGEFPDRVPLLNKICDKHIQAAKKINNKVIKERNKILKKNLKDFGMSHHSGSLFHLPEMRDFAQFAGSSSWEFLNWCGWDLKNYSLNFTEMWVQEFGKAGAGHHTPHTHPDQHVSGFFFLKCSSKTSYPVFHDPRPGAIMKGLPQKDQTKITCATSNVHFTPKPGTMIIVPGYVPHEYPVDMGVHPFRFIHWNLQCVPKKVGETV